MKKCLIKTGREYPVTVGSDLKGELIAYLKSISFNGKVAVISDSNVAALYMGDLRRALIDSGLTVVTMEFPAGEESKTLKTYEIIIKFLLMSKMGREDIVIALGGGVTGDLTGFAAATYMRGIRYIMMPTTLLSMVDSSVGGKTAVDMPEGKNLVGAFYQPIAVFEDISYLDTLDEKIFMQGMAEVIKTGVLKGKDLINLISDYLDERKSGTLEDIIFECVLTKGEYVSEDEFDKGKRKMLNLGHTIGHAVESCSGYTLSHGEAVAIGLNQITMISEDIEKLPYEEGNLIRNILSKTGLAMEIPDNISRDMLIDAISYDKKCDHDKIDIIVIRRIGECLIKRVAIDDFKTYVS
ncbi:MAG: 3-dehydroquinate synthase [Lachnospiraceae bacterium]|nr:3-dehydroquinate synthase [Lachnospiraceae bacterium]